MCSLSLSNHCYYLKSCLGGVTSHVCAVNLVDGTTALHQALLGSDAHQILALLLEADIGPLNIQDDKGETALHLACRLNRKKCVEFLVVSC